MWRAATRAPSRLLPFEEPACYASLARVNLLVTSSEQRVHAPSGRSFHARDRAAVSLPTAAFFQEQIRRLKTNLDRHLRELLRCGGARFAAGNAKPCQETRCV